MRLRRSQRKSCCNDERIPVLEPDLYRALGHVDLLGYSFASGSRGRSILVELYLESDELILSGALALLVLLLLCKSALARRAARVCVVAGGGVLAAIRGCC